MESSFEAGFRDKPKNKVRPNPTIPCGYIAQYVRYIVAYSVSPAVTSSGGGSHFNEGGRVAIGVIDLQVDYALEKSLQDDRRCIFHPYRG